MGVVGHQEVGQNRGQSLALFDFSALRTLKRYISTRIGRMGSIFGHKVDPTNLYVSRDFCDVITSGAKVISPRVYPLFSPLGGAKLQIGQKHQVGF